MARADIEPLARYIMLTLAAKHGHVPPRLDRQTVARLRAYGWPGNVRELENVIERSLILGSGESFVVDLASGDARASTPMTFEEGSRRVIMDALRACDGRVYGPRGAAVALKLKPTTLMSKMKKLRIKAKRS
jgi:DNA-binding NtrC family response regulator